MANGAVWGVGKGLEEFRGLGEGLGCFAAGGEGQDCGSSRRMRRLVRLSRLTAS